MKAVAEIDVAGAEHALVDRILALVRQRTGTDFSLYRQPTVRRRIGNRMISLGIAALDEYARYLDATRGEALQLLARLTIKVSRFYRNRATFDHLRSCVIPELARAGEPLRIWSAGCGCGEEAYTLAMLLADAGVPGTVHATDIDPQALDRAAAAIYGPDALDDLPCDLAARFLQPIRDPSAPCYRVRENVRDRVVFARYDITGEASLPTGAPFDLVAFRNVAIYFRRDVHDEVFARVVAALRPGGYLCLGEAEWPPASLEPHLCCAVRRLRLFRSGWALGAEAA